MNRSLTTAANILDRVCGTRIDSAIAAAGFSTFVEGTIHFCSRSCKTTIDAAAGTYTAEQSDSSYRGGNACRAR